ncbi:M56 family metallopeptidase [Luteimonas dalianensis]|uniref:M56 family metallopeptidase n=1 Tax=Luteimonas dalianensis TaxID=1148196 RepID=UPI003BF15D9E
MSAEPLLRWLVDGTLAVTAAIALVLLLRIPLRRAFGARVAYGAWALVPLALAVAALPRPGTGQSLAPELLALHPGVLVVATVEGAPGAAGAAVGWPLLLAGGWLLGAVLFALCFMRQQRRFVAGLGRLRREAGGVWRGANVPGPALVGALRPRIVLPMDFESRLGADEAALVLAHERAHLARGDTRANLVAVVLRCLQWFNPLLHWADSRFRLDQELACDAAVLAHDPSARRRYAGAMLNVQLAVPGLPVGCHWQSSQSLKERILMLKKSEPRVRRRRLGMVALCVLVSATSYGAWAFRPADTVAVAATVSGQPPAAPVNREASVEQASRALAPPRYPAEAAHKWRFNPATRDGEPVEAWMRVPVEFEIGDPEPDAQDGDAGVTG